MEFKEGVVIDNLQAQMILALIIAEEEYKKFGTVMVITAANNGQHMINSKHGSGQAVDLRTKTVGLGRQLVEAIQKKLKPIGYDVLFEDEAGPNEHCHIEYDPKV